ncbi:MAG: FAD-dependent oxidoreductase [Chitinophagaceae bacterium]|nr:FAD-dependent oxidoreductase [Chitinophagaceae bacterium]
MKTTILILSLLMSLKLLFGQASVYQPDVLVYGATPSGIMAAVAVKKAGRSVLIVEPGRWVGGILGAGLKPVQDMPNYEAVGGATRKLMLWLGVRKRGDSITIGEVRKLSRDQISPLFVREDFLKLLNDNDIKVIYNHRVSRTEKQGNRIERVFFDFAPFDEDGCPVEKPVAYDALQVHAKMMIDAGYEGELMARSGVSNRIGRESVKDYNESLAGVRPLDNITPIDPFVVPGNPESGLLPLVENDHGKLPGAGDQYTQAYNYRFYVTSDPKRRVPVTAPEGYNRQDFELVGRYVDYLKKLAKDTTELYERLSWIFPGWLNAGEYNYQRRSLITIAPLGINHLYADGDYATKARIWKSYQDYFRGLYHFLSTDERVPKAFREKTGGLGLDKFHHPETNGWPHQLYIRASRRLLGLYTITEHDVYNKTKVDDPIGLAQYGIDTYPARRIWFTRNDSVFVAIEGNMFVGGDKGPTNVPYPIPYRSIVPLRHECSNLLVTACFSATHLGYASARMEPTFMIVGESAGVAAVQALEEGVPVQNINMQRYLKKLLEAGQRLYWK